jgi:hypothetical protein
MTYGLIALSGGLLTLYVIFNLIKLKQIGNEKRKRKEGHIR